MSYLKKILLLSFVATISAYSQNYEISISINTRNDTVLLGHYMAKSSATFINDTVVLRNGRGVFSGNRILPKGVYFLVSDGRLLFDLIIGDSQQFGIVADTADLFNLTRFTSSPDNEAFYRYRRYNVDRHTQLRQLNEQFRNATTDEERNSIRTQAQDIDSKGLEYTQKLIEENSDLYVSKVLRAIIPLQLPEHPRDEYGNITDSMYVYRWWRNNFFSNLDIFDPDMLRTQFYEEKLFEYIQRVIPQHTDTINAELDKILTRAHAVNDEVFRFILRNVFNHFAGSQEIIRGSVVPENIWVHLAEKWFIPYSHWSTEEFIENLSNEVTKRKPNLIGAIAPPMEMLMILPPEHFRAAASDTAIKHDLHAGRMVNDFRTDNQLKNKFTVLYFWDFDCGHCRRGIQELFEVWEEYKDKGMQVITVQTVVSDGRGKGRWIDFVNEHNLFGNGWINAWSPYSYKYKEMYNIATVPVTYLLNENFEIILRGIVTEHVKDFFENQVH